MHGLPIYVRECVYVNNATIVMVSLFQHTKKVQPTTRRKHFSLEARPNIGLTCTSTANSQKNYTQQLIK